MAEKRMFAKSIVLSDAFLDMPMSARCLYFTLSMFADDDGFVGSPKGIMRQCGASQDDMMVLLQKRFILAFDSGVIVIKHWRINNFLRTDRHKDTTYQEELATLMIDEKGAYTEIGIPSDNQLATIGIPSIDKNSIDKNSIDIDTEPPKNKKSKYGEYQKVLLTDKEYEKLEKDFTNRDELIKFLDEYIERKGYKAKSHYLCIRGWVKDAVEEAKVRKNRSSNNYNNKPSNYYKDQNSEEYDDLDRFYM